MYPGTTIPVRFLLGIVCLCLIPPRTDFRGYPVAILAIRRRKLRPLQSRICRHALHSRGQTVELSAVERSRRAPLGTYPDRLVP